MVMHALTLNGLESFKMEDHALNIQLTPDKNTTN